MNFFDRIAYDIPIFGASQRMQDMRAEEQRRLDEELAIKKRIADISAAELGIKGQQQRAQQQYAQMLAQLLGGGNAEVQPSGLTTPSSPAIPSPVGVAAPVVSSPFNPLGLDEGAKIAALSALAAGDTAAAGKVFMDARNREADYQRSLQKPYTDAIAKGEADIINEKKANEEGAKSFLKKIERMRQEVKLSAGDTGPVSGSSWNRGLAGAGLAPSAETRRTKLGAALSAAELDVAKMKLKGQGNVTENERAIARATLPQLTNSYEANMAILDALEAEAYSILGKEPPTRAEELFK